MSVDRSKLSRLAENRQRRLADRARPSFELTDDEIEASTDTAMRLADAAPHQIADEAAPRPATRPPRAA
ncbi:MAG TPA: hypothetical protein VK501_10210 [Baekduia sp.]|uniref:hypothetical protein n=1 Tax=Baekduia sp. TaxID=2600305 RepID=UPI002CA8EB0E|nr:hypothetical protein [Baekduia sp.]HMJ34282.1 hypothetical protein [Baekduia sp.]